MPAPRDRSQNPGGGSSHCRNCTGAADTADTALELAIAIAIGEAAESAVCEACAASPRVPRVVVRSPHRGATRTRKGASNATVAFAEARGPAGSDSAA